MARAQAKLAAHVRDGHRCRQCSVPEREGRAHDVHHIRPFREFGYIRGENRNDRMANDLENLITLCPTCHQRAEAARGARSALAGLSYALRNIAPLYLMCDPRDLEELMIAAKEMVQGCGCLEGCPACVGPAGPGVSDLLARAEGRLNCSPCSSWRLCWLNAHKNACCCSSITLRKRRIDPLRDSKAACHRCPRESHLPMDAGVFVRGGSSGRPLAPVEWIMGEQRPLRMVRERSETRYLFA